MRPRVAGVGQERADRPEFDLRGGQPGVTTCVSRSNYANCAIFLPAARIFKNRSLNRGGGDRWQGGKPLSRPSRPRGLCRAVRRRVGQGLHLPARAHAAATERATCPSDVASANLPPGFMRPCNPQPPGGNAARAHRYAAVVPSIDPAMLPAAAARVEVLEEAVPRTTPRVSQRDCRRLLEQPDCLQVTFPAKGWLQVATGNEPPGSLRWFESRANLRRARSKEFDQRISSGHTSGTSRKGRSFVRVPSLGKRS
jgi:hypothetical protein